MGSNATNASIERLDTTINIHAIVLLAVDMPVILVTIVGNGIFLITLISKHSLHTPSNVLLGALACSDLLVGIVAQPLWICKLCLMVSGKESNPFIDTNYLVMWAFILFSSLFISIVSLDRYIAVCFPLWYQGRATCKTHIKIAVLLLVSCIICYCIGHLIISETKTLVLDRIYADISGISLFTTGFCNVKLFTVIKQQQIRIRHFSTGGSHTQPSNTDRDSYKTWIVLIITLLFFACYSPMLLMEVLLEEFILFSERAYKITHVWIEFLVLFNSCVNPVVYYARMKSFREAASAVFCHARTNV